MDQPRVRATVQITDELQGSDNLKFVRCAIIPKDTHVDKANVRADTLHHDLCFCLTGVAAWLAPIGPNDPRNMRSMADNGLVGSGNEKKWLKQCPVDFQAFLQAFAQVLYVAGRLRFGVEPI